MNCRFRGRLTFSTASVLFSKHILKCRCTTALRRSRYWVHRTPEHSTGLWGRIALGREFAGHADGLFYRSASMRSAAYRRCDHVRRLHKRPDADTRCPQKSGAGHRIFWGEQIFENANVSLDSRKQIVPQPSWIVLYFCRNSCRCTALGL